jgi:hypothetical protein
MTTSRLSTRIAKLETAQGNRNELDDASPEELRERLVAKVCGWIAEINPEAAEALRTTLTPHEIVQWVRNVLVPRWLASRVEIGHAERSVMAMMRPEAG